MPTYEGLRLKVLKYRRKWFAESRKKNLRYTDFTIISNNCWGGMVYESYNLPKNSPTVGLFFMAEDYIKFLTNLEDYIKVLPEFIKPQESKWYGCEQFKNDKKFGSYPIGVLTVNGQSVEIFFLHYHSEEEARDKWTRRCERINFDRLLVKFNDQNGCTREMVEEFLKLPYKNKLFFTCKKWDNLKDGVTVLPQMSKKDFILASYEPFGKNRRINITSVINNLK